MSFRTSSDINKHLRNVLGLPEPEQRRATKRSLSPENTLELDDESDNGIDTNDDFVEETGVDESQRTTNQAGGAEIEGDDEGVDTTNNIGSDPDIAMPHPLFRRGRDIYTDDVYIAHVKAVSHRRRTRYSLSDHIFDLKIRPKDSRRKPYLINLEEIIGDALINILDRLKRAYKATIDYNQVYITVIEKHIIKGINSGNYSLKTPSHLIAAWVLGLLYNYLKSRQTMRLNNSFKIQVKVISARHVRDLEEKKKRPIFVPHTYH